MKGVDVATSVAKGQLHIHSGCDSEYDAAVEGVTKIQQALESRLNHLRRELGAKGSEVVYKDGAGHSGRYFVDIKSKFLQNLRKPLPSDLSKVSNNATATRFQDAFVVHNLPLLEQAEQQLQTIQASLLITYLQRIDGHFEALREAVRCTAELDCLVALAKTSMMMGEGACRPQFVPSSKAAFIEVEECRHLLISPRAGQDVIPNSLAVGGLHPSTLLLTGPNMGGKSTLLRQTCIAFILAQIGCYVPAKRCRLSPVDRIFTRVGSSDNMLAGRSTFMVELCETSTILRHASPHSLVVFDELGRGTSTWDGYAIAFSVLHHFERVPAVVLFSTHYHSLSGESQLNTPRIQFAHMACYVEEDDISFLYSLQPGISTNSYAMEVALMAGIPKPVVNVARHHADRAKARQARTEAQMHQHRQLWDLFGAIWKESSHAHLEPGRLANLQLKHSSLQSFTSSSSSSSSSSF